MSRPARLAVAALLSLGSVPGAWAQAGPFTPAQVKAGHGDYYSYCGQCHGDDLAGSGEAPPLTGGLFSTDWGKRSIREFYAFISTAMPSGLAGDLSAATYSNIVAYILAANGAAPGAQPLDKNSDIKIGDIANGQLVPGVVNDKGAAAPNGAMP